MKVKTRPNVVIWGTKVGLSLVTALICVVMLELSIEPSLKHLWQMEIKYVLLNLLTVGVLFAVFLIVSNRIWLANLLCGLFCGLVAIINYYVVLYHRMPLSMQELKNFATAMNVISGYKLEITEVTKQIVLLMLAAVFFSLLCRHFTKKYRLQWRAALIRDVVLCLAGFLIVYTGYFGGNPVKPKNTLGWLWSEPYYKYGYAASTVESIQQSFNIVQKPEGYSLDAIDEIAYPTEIKEETQTPDIILILNETFYDLRQITDIETDVPYLENIESMQNLLTGYAVVPNAGGGTNSSEYELLTSNSLQLMPGITPFNVLDLQGANSVVSHLNSLGYQTLGAHSEAGENYSRIRGYAGLGFQSIHFDVDFQDVDFYYNRWFETDESLYKNLCRWYEEMDADIPRFMYLLTIQNHGGWDLNDPEYDTVHSLVDYGEYTQQVNEYLTGISLSDQAFKDLTDYFSSVDRPVIVCMLGDHCPTFAEEIADEKYEGNERTFRARQVPLLIWANFELEDTDLGIIGINQVIPTLLEIGQVKLSPYYSYLLSLKEQVPVLTSYNVYYDINGERHLYEESSPYEEMVENYFFLEYNNLSSERRQELFDPFP